MKKITLSTFNEAPYLSYGFDCDGSECYSGFGLKTDAFAKKISTLIPTALQQDFLDCKTVEVNDEVFSSIQSEWFKSRYKKYKGVYVSREADMDFVKAAYVAYENQTPVMIQYEDGYAMYPSDDDNSCVSDDGLTHVAFVGKSTGVKPVLLHMESSCVGGGSEFMFSGIKSIKSTGGALCAA